MSFFFRLKEVISTPLYNQSCFCIYLRPHLAALIMYSWPSVNDLLEPAEANQIFVHGNHVPLNMFYPNFQSYILRVSAGNRATLHSWTGTHPLLLERAS
jgi:hypothetical protein